MFFFCRISIFSLSSLFFLLLCFFGPSGFFVPSLGVFSIPLSVSVSRPRLQGVGWRSLIRVVKGAVFLGQRLVGIRRKLLIRAGCRDWSAKTTWIVTRLVMWARAKGKVSLPEGALVKGSATCGTGMFIAIPSSSSDDSMFTPPPPSKKPSMST